jgi:hypothetical protein
MLGATRAYVAVTKLPVYAKKCADIPVTLSTHIFSPE